MENPPEKRQRLADFPTECKACGDGTPLCVIPYKPEDILEDEKETYDTEGRYCKIIDWDRYNHAPRTFEYTLACPKCPSTHPVLKVIDTPDANFRVVIPANRYNPKRAKRRYREGKKS